MIVHMHVIMVMIHSFIIVIIIRIIIYLCRFLFPTAHTLEETNAKCMLDKQKVPYEKMAKWKLKSKRWISLPSIAIARLKLGSCTLCVYNNKKQSTCLVSFSFAFVIPILYNSSRNSVKVFIIYALL